MMPALQDGAPICDASTAALVSDLRLQLKKAQDELQKQLLEAQIRQAASPCMLETKAPVDSLLNPPIL